MPLFVSRKQTVVQTILVLRTSKLKASINLKFVPDAAAAATITVGTFVACILIQLSFFLVPIRISDRKEAASGVC